MSVAWLALPGQLVEHSMVNIMTKMYYLAVIRRKRAMQGNPLFSFDRERMMHRWDMIQWEKREAVCKVTIPRKSTWIKPETISDSYNVPISFNKYAMRHKQVVKYGHIITKNIVKEVRWP